jgi:hypothetical protein
MLQFVQNEYYGLSPSNYATSSFADTTREFMKQLVTRTATLVAK